MTTQALMKACKSKGSISTWHGTRREPGPGGCLQAQRKKTPVVTGDHISLMFDLQLLISPFQLAFVKLFVVLGVY